MNDLSMLTKGPLFSGIAPADLTFLLDCLSAQRRDYEKHAWLVSAGDAVPPLGVLLLGSAHVVREDFWGHRTIVTRLEPGDLFCESFALSCVASMPLGVQAVAPSQALWLDVAKLSTTCPNACPFHAQLVRNLLQVMADKNRFLSDKIGVLTQRTTREKLLAYLSEQATLQGTSAFVIPFNRQELADFLAVDRSALSTELGKLRTEGLLDFDRNRFTLLHGEDE